MRGKEGLSGGCGPLALYAEATLILDRSNRRVKTMVDVLEYQASQAKAKWAELLDEVERGHTIRITRHGKTIARVVPEVDGRAARGRRGD